MMERDIFQIRNMANLFRIILVIIYFLFQTEVIACGDLGGDFDEDGCGKKLKEEIVMYTEKYKSLQYDEQAKIYNPIIRKYVSESMPIPKIVRVLQRAGFGITVFGNGFYDAYPASGIPSRGVMLSAVYYYRQAFIFGNALSVNIYLYEDGDFSRIKNINIDVSGISP